MKRFIISLFAIGLSLALTASAHAGKPGSSGGNSKKVSGGNSGNKPISYNTSSMKSGSMKSFSKANFKCSHFCWSSKYRCNFYWCQDCWYYWCASRCCYLPISCIDGYPPTDDDDD